MNTKRSLNLFLASVATFALLGVSAFWVRLGQACGGVSALSPRLRLLALANVLGLLACAGICSGRVRAEGRDGKEAAPAWQRLPIILLPLMGTLLLGTMHSPRWLARATRWAQDQGAETTGGGR